jgi:hypothetical protein
MKSKFCLIFLLFILTFLIWGCAADGGSSMATQIPTEPGSTQPPTVESIADTGELVSLTAVLSEIEGEVIAKQSGEDSFYEVANGFVLNSLGQVSTGYEARVRLDISDGSIVRLGANAVFTLDYGKKTAEGTTTKLELNLGQIWVILKGGSIDIDTESGVASIRGSYGGLSVSPTGEVYFTCFEGDMHISLASGVYECQEGTTLTIKGLFDDDPEPGYWTKEQIEAFLNANPEGLEVYEVFQAAVDSPEPDDDLDGVPNTIDDCPDEGNVGFGVDDVGCPNDPPPGDFDGDDVENALDDCPYLGDLGYGVDGDGCPYPPPDKDGDGYPDDVDACDNEGSIGFGLDAYGCPLSDPDPDGDDVLGDDDLCPDEGDEGYGVDDDGCPNPPPPIDPDIDNDGVPNIPDEDKCPTKGASEWGLTPKGCPKKKPPTKCTDTDNDGFCENNGEDECPEEGPVEWCDFVDGCRVNCEEF